MGYKVKESDKNSSPCIWKAETESLIALLAVSVERSRSMDKNKVCRALNTTFLKKSLNPLKKANITRLQRAILDNEGY